MKQDVQDLSCNPVQSCKSCPTVFSLHARLWLVKLVAADIEHAIQTGAVVFEGELAA